MSTPLSTQEINEVWDRFKQRTETIENKRIYDRDVILQPDFHRAIRELINR